MRKLAYPDTTPFSDSASSADFTYLDSEKELAKVLNIQTTGIKEFHIEVKTSKEAENGFVFTSRQLRTVSPPLNSLIGRCAKCISIAERIGTRYTLF
jgi:hypothetical protein